ncbi:hypothetical protein M8494_10925 [Serratia ureilytica]
MMATLNEQRETLLTTRLTLLASVSPGCAKPGRKTGRRIAGPAGKA